MLKSLVYCYKKLKDLYYCMKYSLLYISCGLGYGDNELQLEYKLLGLIHAIEKGMGLASTRLGFGSEKIKRIINILTILEKQENYENLYCYIYAINILNFYIQYHKNNNFENEQIKYLSSFVQKRNVKEIETGYSEYNSNFNRNDFLELIQNRHSIRDYSDKIVEKNIILNCINIARLAPSACNRQSSKVYFSMNRNIIEQIGELIPGNTGFNNVNNYLVITGNMSAYGLKEYTQWMTNAGIFITYLSLIFENTGICNCILQWADFNNSDKKMKNLLSIPENEQIVAALSIGYANNNCKIIKATRKSISDICKEIE